MGIYAIRYSQYVRTEDEYIGQRVKVVKGRKYPIGAEYTIKAFTCWRDMYGRIQTEYAIMTTGEKISVSNLRLVKPKCIHELMVKWVITASDPCPICGARAFACDGTGYDGPSDMYIRHSHCKKCGLDVREYQYWPTQPASSGAGKTISASASDSRASCQEYQRPQWERKNKNGEAFFGITYPPTKNTCVI